MEYTVFTNIFHLPILSVNRGIHFWNQMLSILFYYLGAISGHISLSAS